MPGFSLTSTWKSFSQEPAWTAIDLRSDGAHASHAALKSWFDRAVEIALGRLADLGLRIVFAAVAVAVAASAVRSAPSSPHAVTVASIRTPTSRAVFMAVYVPRAAVHHSGILEPCHALATAGVWVP